MRRRFKRPSHLPPRRLRRRLLQRQRLPVPESLRACSRPLSPLWPHLCLALLRPRRLPGPGNSRACSRPLNRHPGPRPPPIRRPRRRLGSSRACSNPPRRPRLNRRHPARPRKAASSADCSTRRCPPPGRKANGPRLPPPSPRRALSPRCFKQARPRRRRAGLHRRPRRRSRAASSPDFSKPRLRARRPRSSLRPPDSPALRRPPSSPRPPRMRRASSPACSAGPDRFPRRRRRSQSPARLIHPTELRARSRLRPRHPAHRLPCSQPRSRGRASIRN